MFLSGPFPILSVLKHPWSKEVPSNGVGHVYKITRVKTGKSYIGLIQRMSLYDRIMKHATPSSGCLYIRNALIKHGMEEFVVQLLFKEVPEASLPHTEEQCIKMYNTLAPNGYNLMHGGKTSPMLSEIVREKQRATRATPESKKKQCAAMKEMSNRPDVKKRKSVSMIAKCKTNRSKRSASAKISMNTPGTKKRHQEAMKKSHNTESFKQNASKAQKVAQNRPEVAKKKGIAVRAAHAKPEVKERHRKAIVAAFATPVARANRSAAQKAFWANMAPEERERRRMVTINRFAKGKAKKALV